MPRNQSSLHQLFADRDVTAEWHLGQAQQLCNAALERQSATALVYAALEARNGIERLVFEMSVLATGGNLTNEQLQIARNQHGLYRLLEEAMGAYRRYFEFMNMCLEVSGADAQIAVPDIRRGKRLTTALSSYCHCLLDPNTTVRAHRDAWFTQGVAKVQDACTYLEQLIGGCRAAIQPDTMPPEVKELLDLYLAEECDSSTARGRLLLMQPVLEQRFRQVIR